MSDRRRRRKSRESRKGRSSTPSNLQGLSPKAMQKALGQIDTQEIDEVLEVIVRTRTEEIVLEEPEVTIMNMGQELWNIVPKRVIRKSSGTPSIPEAKQELTINEQDVQLIVSTAGVTKEEAISAIEKSGGDIAKAIMSLK
ncbi:MAG: nascent polypeptide-associated complex protein [Candidatus Heimdallarchaeota archaeon]|jgi:nascent polypeptide-associated complex subunit alpha